MAGVARGEHGAEEELDTTKVWVTTPEALDCAPRDLVLYLGADSTRVPRPSGLPWPFFALNPDADAERERYLFLAVVRAARRELRLSYSRQGEDEVYGPAPYLVVAARLLNREKDLELPATMSPQVRANVIPLPVLPGKADEYELHDVAAFGLCPYRFRLERFDPSARRFREGFQLRFVALGVWMDRTFDRMVAAKPFRDRMQLRQALYAAARDTRGGVEALLPSLGKVAWEGIRRQLQEALDTLVDGWLAKPKGNGKAPLDYGVAFEIAPPGVEFSIEVDGRTVLVRSGLRQVVRAGKFLSALPNALTHLHWLLPSYRSDDNAGQHEVHGIELFPDLRAAVAWWSHAVRAALGKNADRDDVRETYRRYRQEVHDRVKSIQTGQFPKHPGDHCELCPVRHTCLGTPEA